MLKLDHAFLICGPFFLAFVLSVYVLFPHLIYAELWSKDNYEEIPQPSMRMCIQSMQTHQKQWTLSLIDVTNLNVPGHPAHGGFNSSKNGRLTVQEFTYWRPGAPEETGNPMDFMIESLGRSFFCFRLSDGKIGYSRDGRFKLDSNRRLVSVSGALPVLNENEQDIYIPNGNDFAVAKNGVIFVNNNPIDKFKIASFDKEVEMSLFLTQVNATFYRAIKTPIYDPNPNFSIRQGFIENANNFTGLLGNSMLFKYANEGSAKIARSQIKLLTSSVQMANP